MSYTKVHIYVWCTCSSQYIFHLHFKSFTLATFSDQKRDTCNRHSLGIMGFYISVHSGKLKFSVLCIFTLHCYFGVHLLLLEWLLLFSCKIKAKPMQVIQQCWSGSYWMTLERTRFYLTKHNCLKLVLSRFKQRSENINLILYTGLHSDIIIITKKKKCWTCMGHLAPVSCVVGCSARGNHFQVHKK